MDATTPKRGPGRPPTGAVSIHLRLPPDELAALDAWTDGQVSRPEAIRRILREALTRPRSRRG